MSFNREFLEAVGFKVRETGVLPATKHYTPRKRRLDNAAEAIAKSADRLEAQAARVRATDKRLALSMQREAEKLQATARRIEQQAKRRRGEKFAREQRVSMRLVNHQQAYGER